KTLLQEYVQKRMKTYPHYKVVQKTGPDHDRTFWIEVHVGGRSFGAGKGKNKKEAEQDAARLAYEGMHAEAGAPRAAAGASGPAGAPRAAAGASGPAGAHRERPQAAAQRDTRRPADMPRQPPGRQQVRQDLRESTPRSRRQP
ncbi:MAG: putative dsRNA-binding protein, partial [Spirochaetes bacterium]|nr:putative dsRNA-binding protein [Spirochaetota bacterium]